jgi:hypothetical protein
MLAGYWCTGLPATFATTYRAGNYLLPSTLVILGRGLAAAGSVARLAAEAADVHDKATVYFGIGQVAKLDVGLVGRTPLVLLVVALVLLVAGGGRGLGLGALPVVAGVSLCAHGGSMGMGGVRATHATDAGLFEAHLCTNCVLKQCLEIGPWFAHSITCYHGAQVWTQAMQEPCNLVCF